MNASRHAQMSLVSHTVVLHGGREDSVRRQHPWIFSGVIKTVPKNCGAGDLVRVVDGSGKPLAVGFWGTGGIAVKVLLFGAGELPASFWRDRLGSAIAYRRRLGLDGAGETTGFRLVHAEGDGLPGLVVDRYGSTLVMQCHSRGMWRRREGIAELLSEMVGPEITTIFDKSASALEALPEAEEWGQDATATDNPFLLGAAPESEIREHHMRFLVDVVQGQKTGFFLDQRMNRRWVRELARDRRVLNCFSYTGGFSVAALMGGAQCCHSVDASKGAIEACEGNVARNGASARHTSCVADCLEYLKVIPERYDLIVLDPPAFVKHKGALESGLRGYEKINALAMRQIEPGGLLFTFSCSQLVSKDIFYNTIVRAATKVGRAVRFVQELHQAPCHPVSLFHPEGEYLKGLLLEVA